MLCANHPGSIGQFMGARIGKPSMFVDQFRPGSWLSGVRPPESHRLRLVSRAVEFPQLQGHFDLARLAVIDMNTKLNIARISNNRVKAIAPLEPRFPLGTGFASFAAYNGLLKDRACALR